MKKVLVRVCYNNNSRNTDGGHFQFYLILQTLILVGDFAQPKHCITAKEHKSGKVFGTRHSDIEPIHVWSITKQWVFCSRIVSGNNTYCISQTQYRAKTVESSVFKFMLNRNFFEKKDHFAVMNLTGISTTLCTVLWIKYMIFQWSIIGVSVESHDCIYLVRWTMVCALCNALH